MNRQQKEAVVTDFKKMFDQSQASFLVNYKGLNVKDLSSLRQSLRENGGKLKITKARLMKIAAGDAEGVDSFKESFKDQVGMVFASQEVPAVAKQLVSFAKDHAALEIVSCFFESKVLSGAEIEFLASLPSKDVMLGRLAGTLQAPIAGFARVLSSVILQLPYALKAVADKKTDG